MGGCLDSFEGGDLFGEVILVVAQSFKDGRGAGESAGGGEDGIQVGDWVVVFCMVVLGGSGQ